jgi:hypothetical protein
MKKGKDITRNRASYFSLMVNYAGGWGASQIDGMPDFININDIWGTQNSRVTF